MRGDGKRQALREQIQSSSRNKAVRIHDELLSGALVEVLVAFWRLIERDRLDVYRLGDLDLVMQDALHELAVVFFHGALTGRKTVALGPAQSDADAQRAVLGVVID